MSNKPVPKWLIQAKHEFLADEDSLSFDFGYIGKCRIDTYRAPGDLHTHWVIKSAESGEIPNANYGVNSPEPCTDIGYFPIIEMWSVTTHYLTCNGAEIETIIYSHDGEVLAYRRYPQ